MQEQTFDYAMVEGYTYCPGERDWPATGEACSNAGVAKWQAYASRLEWVTRPASTAPAAPPRPRPASPLPQCAVPPRASRRIRVQIARGARADTLVGRRGGQAKKHGYLQRTLFCFGFLLGRSAVNPAGWTREMLRTSLQQLRAAYPGLGGVLMYGHDPRKGRALGEPDSRL